MKSIPWLTLTWLQQGGIGYPPSLVMLRGRWWAVKDSRKVYVPEKVRGLLQIQRIWPERSPHYHDQQWVMKKWETAPRLSWNDIVAIVEEQP